MKTTNLEENVRAEYEGSKEGKPTLQTGPEITIMYLISFKKSEDFKSWLFPTETSSSWENKWKYQMFWKLILAPTTISCMTSDRSLSPSYPSYQTGHEEYQPVKGPAETSSNPQGQCPSLPGHDFPLWHGNFLLLDSLNIQQIGTVYSMLDSWSRYWGDKGELESNSKSNILRAGDKS